MCSFIFEMVFSHIFLSRTLSFQMFNNVRAIWQRIIMLGIA